MPTAPPPEVPNVFGPYIDPNNAQSSLNQLQQNQNIQNQGRQFSGREGALGASAGLLSKFIQGASIGRANADAKQVHAEAMKSAQDSQHLNSYIDMVRNNTDLDPDVANQLIAKAYSHQGQMVDTILKESDSPIAKILHPIFQGLMGGAPANESTKTDASGKKTKVRTTYQGPDQDAFKGLMSDYFNASQNMTKDKTYPIKSADLIERAKAAVTGLGLINGQEPTREQAERAVGTLLAQGDVLAQKYGMRTNPVADWIGTYQPKLYGTQLLQDIEGKEREAFLPQLKQVLGGEQPQQQPATQTAAPPAPQQFGLVPPAGPASRIPNPSLAPPAGPASTAAAVPPDQAAAPPAAQQPKAASIDPAFLDRAVRFGYAARQESVIDGEKQIPTVRFNGKTYDMSGNAIDPSKIGRMIYNFRGAPIRVEQEDDKGEKYSVYAFHDAAGKIQIPKDPATDKPYRVPATAGGLRTQITQVFQTVQQLQRQINSEENRMQTIEKDVANDFMIPPAKKAAEVARRRAELQPRIDRMNKNLEANQKILMQYGGPGALYDTGLGSSPPPNQYSDQLDQLQ